MAAPPGTGKGIVIMRSLPLLLAALLLASPLVAAPQLAHAQYGDPEAGYVAPPPAQPVASSPPAAAPSQGPTSHESSENIRLAMQARFSGINVLGGGGFAVSVLATPGLRVASNRLFIGLGVGWIKVSDDAGHAYTVAPTATYDLLQRQNAAFHLLVNMNISDESGGDLTFGMNFGLGVRAQVGQSLGIGTEWGFGFTQLSGGPPDAAFGFFGALMIESSIGL